MRYQFRASISHLITQVLLFSLFPVIAFAGSQTFSTPGTHTFTVPNYTGSLTVTVNGAGGGGSGAVGNNGQAGGQSSFKNTVIGSGGEGGIWDGGGATKAANGWASGGNISNITGGGAAGGIGPRGDVYGRGGSGGQAKSSYASGSLPASVSVVVGAGGAPEPTAASLGGGSAAGSNGSVTISWQDAPAGSCPAHSHGTFPNCVCDAGYTGNGLTGSNLVCSPTPSSLSCQITFDKNPITAGEGTTVHWTSNGADAFYVKSIGFVGSSGMTSVFPSQTTDYSGTVYSCPDGYTLSSDGAQCSKTTQAQVTTGTAGSKSFAGPSWGSGASTFTVPPYGSLTVEVWGGGGMSSASLYDPNGSYCTQFQPAGYCDIEHSNGGRSSWNGSVIANGGQHATTVMSPASSYYNAMGGAGGTASGGDVNTAGEAGHQAPPGGDGRGGNAAGNPPAGYADGGGNPALGNDGAGGGAGGYTKKTYAPGQLTVGASIPVVAGHQGVMTVWALAGGYGTPGLVKVTWTAPQSTTSTGGTSIVTPTKATCSAVLTVNCPTGQHWDTAQNKCVSNNITLTAPSAVSWNTTAVISWSAINATQCTSPDFDTAGETSGSVTTGLITQTTTYTLTCDTGTKTVTVQVPSCPAGYVGTPPVCTLASGVCPAGYTGTPPNCSVASSCPLNYTGTPPNCTPIACVPTNICNGKNVVNSCTGAIVQSCTYQCASGACFVPAPSVVSWTVAPLIVNQGTPTNVSWEVRNVSSCSVSSTNGDSWTGLTGTKVSGAINAQTVFTLTCAALAGSGAPNVTRTATVNIVPVFEEI